VVAFGETTTAGGAAVVQHGFVVGGIDGVVVIPARVGLEVAVRAEEKINGESQVRRRLEEGELAGDVIPQYGIM
jgi:regulator of RNase E activity RraA